jgi:hypothetical protein
VDCYGENGLHILLQDGAYRKSTYAKHDSCWQSL